MFTPSPANRIIRRIGYRKDKKGFLNRYFRESEAWQDHLDNCRQFILTCLKNKEIGELVVLGSGWLLDFPVEILAREIERIKLIDINHPPQVVKKIRMYPGVECITADITGGYVMKIYDDVRKYRKTKVPYVFDQGLKPVLKIPGNSFFISLNIFSQLDTFLTDYLKENILIEEETITRIRSKIQADHIQMLMNTRFILITDYEEIVFNSDKQEAEAKKLIYTEIPTLPFEKEWLWKFDSQGTYNPDRKTVLKVRALCSEMPEIQ